MRKTKIVCTIGPASESVEMLEKLALAGMNVARLNFSHGTHEEHSRRIKNIRAVSSKLNIPIAIMLDTKGPEYRIKSFKDGKVCLNAQKTASEVFDLKKGDKYAKLIRTGQIERYAKAWDYPTLLWYNEVLHLIYYRGI